jgi:hypothetical protein
MWRFRPPDFRGILLDTCAGLSLIARLLGCAPRPQRVSHADITQREFLMTGFSPKSPNGMVQDRIELPTHGL